MWAIDIARRLRELRRGKKTGQEHVARALDISVSEISRLERGVRGLRVEQLGPWAKSLGCRVEMVMWQPPENAAGAGGLDGRLDEESLGVLGQVAAALPYMPAPARAGLAHEMRLWIEANTPKQPSA